MADLKIDRVTKSFGEFVALKSVTLDVADGEFIAVLGPSGCGKTTLLRMIAGFEAANDGQINIGGNVVSSRDRHVPPEGRKVGIVFQSYALWPHMTVAENVGYGLKVAKVAAAEKARRITEALAVVGLQNMDDRSPAQLSGGQRQRVALARCLVTAPSLVLLDEPLANLDVHLRASMEEEFTNFHARTGTTMFYITHDQAEAMAMADRIAVMDGGRIMQVDTPQVLFSRPANEMVASFIGQGKVLPIEVRAARDSNGHCMVRLAGVDVRVRAAEGQKAVADARICLRPSDLSLTRQPGEGIVCRVRHIAYQGGFSRVDLISEEAPDVSFVAHHPDGTALAVGDPINVQVHDGWVIPGSPS